MKDEMVLTADWVTRRSQVCQNLNVLPVSPGPAHRVLAAAALQAVPGHQAGLSAGLLGAEQLAAPPGAKHQQLFGAIYINIYQ